MSIGPNASFRLVIWYSSKSSHMCNLPWLRAAIRSWPSNSSDHSVYWLAWGWWHTKWNFWFLLRCTRYSMFHSSRSRWELIILSPVIHLLRRSFGVFLSGFFRLDPSPKGTRSITQGLIQWSNLPRSLATWEDLEFLRQQFPRATIWDRLGAQGRGSVTTGLSTVPRPAQESEEGAQDSQPQQDSGP